MSRRQEPELPPILVVSLDPTLARDLRDRLSALAPGREVLWRARFADAAQLAQSTCVGGLIAVASLTDLAERLPALRAHARSAPLLVACDSIDAGILRLAHSLGGSALPSPLGTGELRVFVERIDASTDLRVLLRRSIMRIAIRPLSPRQLEIAERFAHGQSRERIRAELGIGLKTLERHVTDIGRRCGTRSLADLSQRAWRDVLGSGGALALTG